MKFFLILFCLTGFQAFAQPFAPEPTAQASNLIFTNVKSYRVSLAFAAANPVADGYLVVRKQGSAINEVPTDGKNYVAGDSVGSTKVVFSGPATGTAVNNIVAGSNYYFAVFAYNGSGQLINYKQSFPLKGSISSSGSMQPANEYNGISPLNATFIQDLHNHINPHVSTSYNNYDETNVDLFASRDTTGGQKVVTCVYSGEQFIYSIPFVWGTFSREHTYCHSWMPTNPANNPELPEYNDQHHLFPTDQINANQVRSNFPLGIVVNPSYTYKGCKFGTDASGNQVFEPRDQHKGDAARALFYMAVCYNGVSGNNWKLPAIQDQEVLKQWHWQDPPDNWEIARNDFLDSLQGNRNPFVDSVNWVCYIDFSTMTKVNDPQPCFLYAGIKGESKKEFLINLFPNPSSGNFSVNIYSSLAQNCIVKITNLLGESLFETSIPLISGNNDIPVALTGISKGCYFVQIAGSSFKEVRKIVIR
jgi:hypothetical protein